MRWILPALLVATMAAATLAPQAASAHGRSFERPPILVVPPTHRVRPHPHWYYSRPAPHYHAPPGFAPAPRFHERRHGRHHRHDGRHRRGHPGMSFEFRF